MHIQPDSLSTRRLYEAMVALITPRPIAWISTRSRDGVDNVAPYSFFNGVGANPPTVMFCPALRGDGSRKHTHENALASGEFVVNLVTEPVFDAMKQSALETEDDEFEMAGLEKADSQVVNAPRVATAVAAMECRLHTALQLGTGPGGANLVIGTIVSIYASQDILDDDGRIDPERVRTVGRMGGPRYCRTLDRME
ncbi:MAG: flavin reductase family protein [Planctomycetota bacterium]